MTATVNVPIPVSKLKPGTAGQILTTSGSTPTWTADPRTAASTTYYVANAGSDSNDGLTSATPWQTVTKVNAHSFSPGDRILFKRGDTWRGTTLVPPSSGDIGRPITFSAYGGSDLAAKPIITGGTVVTSWTHDSGNTYHATSSVSPSYVSSNGVTLTKASSLGAITTNQWWWVGNTLSVNLGGTNPGTVTIETTGSNTTVVNCDGVECLVFDHLDIRFATDGGAILYKHAQKPFTIQNCNFQNNGYTNNGGVVFIFVCNGGGLITKNTFNQNDNDCIWCGAAPDLEISYNVITNMSGSLSDGIQLDGNVYTGGDGRYCSNYWVHHNYIDLSTFTGNKGCITTNAQNTDLGFYGGLVEYNTCIGGNWGVSISNSGAIAQYNLIRDCQVGNQPTQGALAIAAANTTQDQIMRYNVLLNCARGIYLGPSGAGPTNVQVYHNTHYNGEYRMMWAETGTTGTMENNIFVQKAGFTSVCILRLESAMTEDYNVIYPVFSGFINVQGTNYNTLAAYQSGASKGAHSIAVDPLFVSTVDLHLQGSSPAIDAGVALAYGVGQETILGSAPDMGAHEYPRYRQTGAQV